MYTIAEKIHNNVCTIQHEKKKKKRIRLKNVECYKTRIYYLSKYVYCVFDLLTKSKWVLMNLLILLETQIYSNWFLKI